MPGLTFVSGWAGYRRLFDGLACQQFFLPFIDCAPEALCARLRAGSSDILAGWSFGAFCILRDLPQLLPRYKKIVLFAPFLSFSRWHEKQDLDRLTTALATHPQTALHAFWRTCGCERACRIPAKDYPLLRAGLTCVQESRALPAACSGTQLTFVHGGKDKIVPPRATQELQQSYPEAATCFLPQNGHWFSPRKIHEFCHETAHSKRL